MSGVVKTVKKRFKKSLKRLKKTAKKLMKNKFFRIVLIAAAVYFGGAGLSALMSGAPGGFMGGVKAAWSSLGSAGSSLVSGNFKQAFGHLSAGASGTTVAATNTANAAANAAANTAANTAANAGANTAANAGANAAADIAANVAADVSADAAANLAADAALTAGTNTATSSTLANATIEAAKVAAKTQLIGKAADGVGNYLAQRDAEKAAEEERRRRSYWGVTGAGENLYGTPTLDFTSIPRLNLINRPPQTPSTLDDLISAGA